MAADTAPRSRLPNIVFILADDLGCLDVGCYGADDIDTPNIDRLAGEGMRFTDAHSPSAVCTPTRYSVLTGQYCWRSWMQNYVLMEHMPLLIDTDRLTVGSLLKEHGYTTACFGKWHLGWGSKNHPDWNGEVRPGPLDVGFDRYFGIPFSHNSSNRQQVFVEGRRIVGLKPGEDIDDKVVQAHVMRRLEDTTTKISEQAVAFIKENSKQSFFMYYPTSGVHWPHTPHERFKGKSGADTYGDYVVEFDWAVGEIMKALEESGIADNTLLIVTSDNGPYREKSGWRSNKGTIYEGGHRVPFVARWPGRIAPDTVSDKPICLTDLMATCAAIVGAHLPEDAAEDSYSLLPVLEGRLADAPLREALVHHSASGVFAIRQGRWKFIDGAGDGKNPRSKITHQDGINKPMFDPKTGKPIPFLYDWPPNRVGRGALPGQLYDLAADPMEETNLYDKRPDVVEPLKALLERYKKAGRSRRG